MKSSTLLTLIFDFSSLVRLPFLSVEITLNFRFTIKIFHPTLFIHNSNDEQDEIEPAMDEVANNSSNFVGHRT